MMQSPRRTPEQQDADRREEHRMMIAVPLCVLILLAVWFLCPLATSGNLIVEALVIICTLGVLGAIGVWANVGTLGELLRAFTGQGKRPNTHGSAYVGTRDDAAPFRRREQ